MIVIGIDPHKGSHTAAAVDPAGNTDLGSIRIEAILTEFVQISNGAVDVASSVNGYRE